MPAFTTASRTVYVTSSDPHAPVNGRRVGDSRLGAPGGNARRPRRHDLPEPRRRSIRKWTIRKSTIRKWTIPEVDNAEVYNPEVDNPEVENPEVDNPEVDNPEVDNPEVDNIVVGNPEVDNPEVDNPEVDNPEVDNPEVDNPEVDNAPLIAGGGVITDITWTIKNIGNTTTAYNINLFLRHNTPADDRQGAVVDLSRLQDADHQAMGTCDVKTVTQNVLMANIPGSRRCIPPGGEPADPNDPTRTNATLWIEPEQEVA